ncbi:MAG: hypothetical protein DYH12_17820, partial [Sorangiineae bacterium PRO1]|nr:hypothetical protein [Sorangiineae bacterium PRO1]
GAGTAGSGGGSGTCPIDLWAAVGTACSEEGKYCGGEGCNPCEFCNVLYCSGGKWEQQESFPDPNCGDSGSKVCGGLAGVLCADDEWCDLPDGCGYPDAQGVCKPRPQGCTADCPGVCGCDGKFYCNACGANAAGADVSDDKSCMSGDGGVGTSCSSDTECVAGLKCCYPCGQAGCTNQCTVPMGNGECPMYP